MIQGMCQFKNADAVDQICVVSDGSVFVGTPSAIVLYASATSVFDPASRVCLVRADPYVYAIQAGAIKKVSSTGVSAFNATAGSLPSGFQFGCLYRNRLVLSGVPGDPQNYFASRSGTHTDFDYSQTDPAAAFAGNDAKAGTIGDRVTALIAAQDDTMLIGGDHTLYRMDGDIGYGGQIVRVSGQVGVADYNSWCEDEVGTIYFVGSNGLYRIGPGGLPVPLSTTRVDATFRAAGPVTHYIHLTWDSLNHGMYVWLSSRDDATASTHLWWDARTDGFFPIQYPVVYGPVSSIVFDGNSPTDRLLLLGGRAGFVWQTDPAALDDSGTDITSYALLGPVRPGGPGNRPRLSLVRSTFGDTPAGLVDADFSATLGARAADDAESLVDAPTATVTIADVTAPGRQDPVRARIAGNQFALRVDGVAGKYWSVDELALEFLPGGRER